MNNANVNNNFDDITVYFNYTPSDKGPSLRQLSRKGPELKMPLLRLNGDEGENSAADDDDEEQEVFMH